MEVPYFLHTQCKVETNCISVYFVHFTYQPNRPHIFAFFIMTDYMIRHASAYPPREWTFLPNRQPKPSRTSSNELWVEMTIQYEKSMEKRQDLIHSNFLSKTATRDNICRMSPDVKREYNKRGVVGFEGTAEVEDILDIAGRFVKNVDELKENPLETIQEVEDLDGSIEMELLRIKQAIKNTEKDEQLKHSDQIWRSFRVRLMEISSTCYDFACNPLGNPFRPRLAQIGCLSMEVNAHVALAQEQLTSDIAELRDFLRGRLFDQYCLMRGTPKEKKNKTWLKYGECIILGYDDSKCENSPTKETAEILNLGDPEVRDRLYRMINESGLDPDWVTDHIEDYHGGNEHIGRWQRYVQSRRWMDLAEKFTKDIEQLEKINSTRSNNSRRCNIMFNIHNSKRQFFKRLHGARNFELSEKALRMEEEEYDSSSTPSPASSSTTSPGAVS